MNKKLTVKTQYLNPTHAETVDSFAKAINIEPESNDLLLKRGTITAVYSVSGKGAYETTLINKVVHDILHDSYFNSDNISPIQSLEKAIAEVRDKVLQLSNETINPENPETMFNIIAGVLWGNVMYIVQYGEAQSYLIRAGEVRPINPVSEGTFSSASGVVRDDDVIIFCSKDFIKTNPVEKLMVSTISEQELGSSEACVIMKFIVDTTFSPNEVVDFGIEQAQIKKTNKVVKLLQNFTAASLSLFKKIHVPKLQPAKKRSELTSVSTLSVKTRNPRGFHLANLFKPIVILPLLAVALTGSIFWSIKNKSSEKANETKNETQIVTLSPETKKEEPDNEIFYDLKIADATVVPSGIAVFDNTVVATDQNSGKIYTSNTDSAKFTALTETFPGIKNPLNIAGKLGFTDDRGYKVYDLSSQKLTEDYKQTGMGPTWAYLDFIYSITTDTLNKYTKSGQTLESSVWAQAPDFSNAKSIVVNYSIYVITSDGNLVKYTSGKKDGFTLTGDQTALSNPTKLFSHINLDNIYIADAGNKRIVEITSAGVFVKQFNATDENRWDNLTGVALSPEGKIMFVLNGSKVYRVTL